MRIQERFVSVQGEGALVGVPSSFIRVSGCNLRCAWCDTPRTSWAPEGEAVELDALVRWCAAGPRHVVLTGGEPMLFAASAALSQRLRAAGHHLTIETAGTRRCPGIAADLMSISPKLGHSTPWDRARAQAKLALAERHERDRLDLAVLRELTAGFAWQLKFVVRCADAASVRADLDEIEDLLAALEIPAKHRDRVLLMPEGVDAADLEAGYRVAAPLIVERGLRLGLRLHIQLYGNRPGT
ncbi:7-carboxy-7-deazaguanine synthase QueE [Pseudenhygromyxa sp. WMMC2535]|nr:7-carboxy-7-deazaguanine synthase QueE [Pseudenhygromyxa sp. WMMC2535]